MLEKFWPLALIVGSNVVYNIATKGTPAAANAFFSLVITYLVGAAAALALFLALPHERGLTANLSRLNWTSCALGIVIVGLEAGYVFLYRAGWPIGMGSLVANSCLAVILLLVGVVAYRETLTLRQGVGMALCAVGLVLVNMK